jgi:negative modulator of initiation of replication
VQIDITIHYDQTESREIAALLRVFEARPPKSASPLGEDSATTPPSALEQFLRSPSYRSESNVLDRFKRILSWLYSDNPEYFDTMVAEYVEGATGRICLGRSEGEVNASGTNVNAQRIPNTPYWVETNSDTTKKKKHLGEWMIGLARTDTEIELALSALGESRHRT